MKDKSGYTPLQNRVFEWGCNNGHTFTHTEINDIIDGLIKPAFHQGMGKGNPFIPDCEIRAMFEDYDGYCAWINGRASNVQ